MFTAQHDRASALTTLRDAAYVLVHGAFLYYFVGRCLWLCAADQIATAHERFGGFVVLSLLLLVVPMWGLVAAGARALPAASATVFLMMVAMAGCRFESGQLKQPD